MRLEWGGTCTRCNAPLDIIVFGHSIHQARCLESFRVRLPFTENYKKYKFCGHRAQPLCTACYHNINNIKCQVGGPFLREITGKYPRLRRSMTRDEVQVWFADLKQYCSDTVAEEAEEGGDYMVIG